MMRVYLLYLKIFWKTNANQNVHIGISRKFDGLSKCVIRFFKILLYNDDIPNMLSNYFFQERYDVNVSKIQLFSVILIKEIDRPVNSKHIVTF